MSIRAIELSPQEVQNLPSIPVAQVALSSPLPGVPCCPPPVGLGGPRVAALRGLGDPIMIIESANVL